MTLTPSTSDQRIWLRVPDPSSRLRRLSTHSLRVLRMFHKWLTKGVSLVNIRPKTTGTLDARLQGLASADAFVLGSSAGIEAAAFFRYNCCFLFSGDRTALGLWTAYRRYSATWREPRRRRTEKSFFPLQTCIFSSSQLFLPQTRVFFTSCIFSASWLVFFALSFFHVSKKNASVFQNLRDSLRTDQDNPILQNLHSKILSVKIKI